MDFNTLPIETQLQLIINDLSACHVQGADALKFGSALQALIFVLENARNNDTKEVEK